jgi:ribosomal protein S18 acetylase RimI-like enzyme
MSLWGWSEEEQVSFLRIQFECQRHSYKQQYPHLENKIILFTDRKVGRILVSRTGGEIVLVDIALLPEYRDKGIGTTLVTELQQEATSISTNLRLSVLRNSPAQRLYERLGFRATDQNEMYIKMEWNKEYSEIKK